MSEADLIWAGLVLAGAAFEGYTLTNGRKGDTLSETTRSLFRTRTSRIGRVAFGLSWAAFSIWFAGHILYGWPFPLS